MSVPSPPKGATLIPSTSAFPGQPRTGALCSANHREAKQDYLQRGYSSFEATEEPDEAGKKEKVMEDSQPVQVGVGMFQARGRSLFPSATLLYRKAPTGALETSIPSITWPNVVTSCW